MATNAAARVIVLLRAKCYRVNLPVIAEEIDEAMHLSPLFDAIRGVLKAYADDTDYKVGPAMRKLEDAFKATEGD